MGMDSYLEMFTTMYGWMFSNLIWNVLVSTGIIFLPLLITGIATVIEGHEIGEENGSASWMIRKIEIQAGIAVFVLSLCCAPVMTLDNSKVYYTPDKTTAEPIPTTATIANPDSSYGTAFSDVPANALVPVWWYAIMALSSGFNASVKAGITSNIQGFRLLEQSAHIASIQDPLLRAEIQRFNSECFVPARSRYLAAGLPSSTASTDLTTYGQSDPDWIGSHVFRDDPNLYANLQANDVVPGFPFDSSRDVDIDTSSGTTPTYGRPTCKDWWENSSTGLRQKMTGAVGKVAALTTNLFPSMSTDDQADKLAHLALETSKPAYVDPEKIMGDDRSNVDQALHATSDVLSAGGILSKGFEASTTVFAMVQFLTIGQPLILMGIYMFLPLIIVFSRYSLKIMMWGGLAIFTIKFWSAMWFIARWLDDHLIAAMYPGNNVIFEALSTGLDGSIKRTTLNIVLLSMYAGFPLIWSGMMAWIGFHLGKGIEAVQNQATSSANSAGKAGEKIGTEIGGKLIS